jgi:hypothetical protein
MPLLFTITKGCLTSITMMVNLNLLDNKKWSSEPTIINEAEPKSLKSRNKIKTKNMKQIKFLTLLFVGLSFISLSSCSNDDDDNKVIDIRDQYVGNWNSATSGSLTLYQNGQTVGTVPINESNTVTISKSGSNALLIDGTSYIVNGNNLSSNPTPVIENSDGFNIVGTAVSNGTLGSNIISFNDAVTGTWNATTGASGNLSGAVIKTLTR